MLGIGKKNKIKVVFVKPLGEKNYEKIAEKNISKEDESVSYEDKTYPLTGECYMVINNNIPHIYIDYENDKILTLINKDIGVNAKFLDKLISTSKRGIIAQLLYAVKLDMKPKAEWITLAKPITYLIIGVVIGYLIGNPKPF